MTDEAKNRGTPDDPYVLALEIAVDAAETMLRTCPADHDATIPYEIAVHAFDAAMMQVKRMQEERGTNSATTVPAESKWPCFWCGSMQAHETGWPGGMSTVPACAEHAADFTQEKAMQMRTALKRRISELEADSSSSAVATYITTRLARRPDYPKVDPRSLLLAVYERTGTKLSVREAEDIAGAIDREASQKRSDGQ